MPDLSTLPARPVQANTASQTATTVAVRAPPSASFLGQLQQSLSGKDVAPEAAGSATLDPLDPTKAETHPSASRQGTQSAPTKELQTAQPPTLIVKATALAQTAPNPALNKKTTVQNRSAPTARAQDATDTAAVSEPSTQPTRPPSLSKAPTAPLPANDSEPVAQEPAGDTATAKPGSDPAATEATLSHVIDAASATIAQPKPKTSQVATTAAPATSPAKAKQAADPAPQNAVTTTTVTPPSEPPAAAWAPAPASQPAVDTHAPPANGDKLPTDQRAIAAASAQTHSSDSRRTTLAKGEPASPNAAAATEPANLPASTAPTANLTTTAPPATSVAPALLQPAASSVAQPSQPNTPPPPAVQVAQAIAEPVRVLLATPAQQSDAPHVTTIQLNPAELGRVEVRIERTTDGPAKVELAAERPETLLRLVHDQPQLQQALDLAGIPQQGRTISFSLATDNGTANSSFTNSAGDGTSNSNGQRSQQGYGNQQGSPTDTDDTIVSTPAWSRFGLDITA